MKGKQGRPHEFKISFRKKRICGNGAFREKLKQMCSCPYVCMTWHETPLLCSLVWMEEQVMESAAEGKTYILVTIIILQISPIENKKTFLPPTKKPALLLLRVAGERHGVWRCSNVAAGGEAWANASLRIPVWGSPPNSFFLISDFSTTRTVVCLARNLLTLQYNSTLGRTFGSID